MPNPPESLFSREGTDALLEEKITLEINASSSSKQLDRTFFLFRKREISRESGNEASATPHAAASHARFRWWTIFGSGDCPIESEPRAEANSFKRKGLNWPDHKRSRLDRVANEGDMRTNAKRQPPNVKRATGQSVTRQTRHSFSSRAFSFLV